MALFYKLTDNEFDMVTLKKYGLKLKEAGFANVMLRDRNEWYLDVAKRELDTIRGLEDEIIAAVGLETYENAWESFWQILVNTSETHFAENDGVSIAHQVFGDSPGFHFS